MTTTDDTPWLDADQQRHWRAFVDGTTRLIAAIGRDHERHATLPLDEYELLVRLSEQPDHTMRMSALASDLARSRSRLSHMVARMEARGLVRREAAGDDRRGVHCAMTPQGYDRLVAAAPIHVAAVRRFMVDVLSPEQFRSLGEAMAAVESASRADSGL